MPIHIRITFLDAVMACQIFMHRRFWVPLSLPVPKNVVFLEVIRLE